MRYLKSVGLAMTTLCLCLNPLIPTMFSPAIAQTTIAQNQKTEGDRLLEQGNQQLSSDPQAALQSFQKALVIYQESKNRAGEGQAFKNLGNAAYSLKNYTQSIDYQQHALAISREIKDFDLEARALNNLGNAYKELENTAKAIELYHQALAVAARTQNHRVEQITLSNLVQLSLTQKDVTKTVEYLQKLLLSTQKLKDQKAQATTLALLGVAYISLKDYQKAIESAQTMVAVARDLQNPEFELLALGILISAYRDLKDYKKLIESSQQAIVLARQLKNRDSERSSFESLITAQLNLKDYQSAIVVAQQFLASSQQLNQQNDQVLALSFLALAYANSGNSQMAQTSLNQAEAIAQSLKPLGMKISALLKVQNTYETLGNLQKAEELTQKALAMAKDSQDVNLMSQVAEYFIGYRFRQSGNLVEALEQYLNLMLGQKTASSSSPAIAKKMGANNGVILGLYVLLSEDLNKMDGYLDRYWLIVRQTKDKDLELGGLLIQTFISWKKADYVKAESTFDQFLVKARENQDPRWNGAASVSAPLIFYATQNYRKLAEASERFLELQPDNQSGSLLSAELLAGMKPIIPTYLALSYANLNNYKKAIAVSQQNISLIEQALMQANQTQARTNLYSSKSFALNILADVYRQTGQYEKAIQTYREALETDLATSNLLGGSTASDNWKYFSNPALSYVGLARIYLARNMPVTATTYYKQAISKLEQVQQDVASEVLNAAGGKLSDVALANSSQHWKQFFLKRGELGDLARTKSADVYRELADLLLSQGRILEAQQVLERLKTHEVQDFTRSSKTENEVAVPQTPKEGQITAKSNSLIAFGQRVDDCEQKTCAQLKQLLDQRDALVQQFDSEVQAIEGEFRDRNIRNTDDASLAPKDFLPQAESIVEAQPGTVLIYPLVMENRTWLLWASRGVVVKQQEVPGVGQKQIGETVLKLRQLLQNPNSDLNELKTTSKQLYDWLIKPIESELSANDIRNLVFSLDRATRYIPMAALFDGEKFLLERYTVSTVLSAGYTDMSDRLPFAFQNTNVLALGLSQAKDGFDPLPNVPVELDAIVRQGNADKAGVFSGRELLNNAFTFPALRQNLGKQRIVHIATHGKFVPVNPNQSFLLLGDGRLEIPRIRTLQNLRNIDLVVLSACETALGGADQDGVEIAGISSYFLQRGRAKAVMASLWQVNDASTSLLMQQFYKQLATGKVTKAEALRQAQLTLLERKITAQDAPVRSDINPQLISGNLTTRATTGHFSHPYYWAPFILIGNSL